MLIFYISIYNKEMQKKVIVLMMLLLSACKVEEVKLLPTKQQMEYLAKKYHLQVIPKSNTTKDITMSFVELENMLKGLDKLDRYIKLGKFKATRIAYGTYHTTETMGVYWEPIGYQLNVDVDYTYCTQYNSFLSAQNLRAYLVSSFIFPVEFNLIDGSQKYTVNAGSIGFNCDIMVTTTFGFGGTPFAWFRSQLLHPSGGFTNDVITTDREPNESCSGAIIDPTQNGNGNGGSSPSYHPVPWLPLIINNDSDGVGWLPDIIDIPIVEPNPIILIPIEIVT